MHMTFIICLLNIAVSEPRENIEHSKMACVLILSSNNNWH